MGEEKTEDAVGGKGGNGVNGQQGKSVSNGIDVNDDEGDEDADGDGDGEAGVDSPFGGTGLEAVAAANRSG